MPTPPENNRRLRLALFAILTSAGAPALAQSSFLRAGDTRTSVPEAVLKERKDWGADLDFGGSVSRGNVDTDSLNARAGFFAARGPLSAYLTGLLAYGTISGARVRDQGSLTLRLDRKISGPWKVFGYHTGAYNDFVRLSQRFTTGAGPWYDFGLGPSRHGLSLALSHEYERFRGGQIERAGRLSWRLLSQAALSKTAELESNFFYVPKLDEPRDYRFYAEIGLKSMIWKDRLGLKVSWVDEYDSRPKPGVKANDTLWTTSLTLRLGR